MQQDNRNKKLSDKRIDSSVSNLRKLWSDCKPSGIFSRDECMNICRDSINLIQDMREFIEDTNKSINNHQMETARKFGEFWEEN